MNHELNLLMFIAGCLFGALVGPPLLLWNERRRR